ncbi:nuclease-related domain-containing protein [Shewanella sp. Isolate7]|uniref:nuclease-related domain-containing protein n=1 Tax=Shewanella sp. Isolate7 TaxID=2908528 RepID=UPI001EFD8A27|nr:nuclease-related domain-containing protein [Shewanella sp. Isolate7]MCG9722951.1 NERD domain-containing protein [Shewanella sp. Isolate7]
MTELAANLISIAVLLSGMFVVMSVAWLILKRRDLTLDLPVDRDQLIRIPAYGLQQQIQDLQMDVIGALVIAVMVVAFPFATDSLRAHIIQEDVPWLFIFTIVIGLIYSGCKTWKAFTQLTKLRLGHTAEIATANELIGLQALGYQVFHDVQAESFYIDHLAIGKNGVFAIETKGRHKRTKDNRLCFPSWQETKPIEQASRQAKWVGNWLTKASGVKVNAMPVLVFPGWYVTNQSRPPFPILNHKQLVKTLGNCEQVLQFRYRARF